MTLLSWTRRLAKLSARRWLTIAFVPITLVGTVAISLLNAAMATKEVALFHVNAGLQLTATMAQRSDLALLYESSATLAETAASLFDNPLVRQIRVIGKDGKVLFDRQNGSSANWAYPEAPDEGTASADLDGVWLFSRQVRTATHPTIAPELPEAVLLGNTSNEVLGQVQLALSKDALFKARQGIFLGSVLASLVFSLLAVLAMLLIVRRISKPLESLADAMHETRVGAWTEPELPKGPLEVRQIGESYVALMAVLRQREEQLRDFNQDLEDRIQQRTYALEAANKELEAFSYSASHDLRAPLRAIDGFGKALLEDFGPTLEPVAKDYLQRMCDAARRMSELIDSLLKLSRVTRYDMQLAPVDMTQMAEAIIAELRQQSPERKVDFRVTPGLLVRGDPNMLQIALSNLIGNAWKYTSQTASADISLSIAERRSHETVYVLRDNGAGFDMRYADKLFGAFQRLHGREFEGTGIGLAIVKRVFIRHGGSIWAEAEVGKGARFYFSLPDGAP